MMYRLGQVLSWLMFGIAALLLLVGAYVIFFEESGRDSDMIFLYCVFCALVWGLGRAIRYVLSGY
jgi:drug/metabolite transporter (DMT)-like permease